MASENIGSGVPETRDYRRSSDTPLLHYTNRFGTRIDRCMDAVWIKTVRLLELELAEYRRMRQHSAKERDQAGKNSENAELARMKTGLNLRYSQIIAFTAGMSDADIVFDSDLEQAAVIISREGRAEHVFGPSAITSTDPYLSPELREYIDNHTKATENSYVGSDKRTQTPLRNRSDHFHTDLSLLDYLERNQQDRTFSVEPGLVEPNVIDDEIGASVPDYVYLV